MVADGFPVPENEEQRLRTLAGYDVVGVPPIPDLTSATELAAYVCGKGKAVVNIIGEDHQFQIAATGFQPGVCRREDSMCAIAITESAPLMVPDARVDPRFAQNPFVTGVIDRVRFYASSQLRAPDGMVLGTLCVFDGEPGELSRAQQEGLDKLAKVVVDVLELRRHGELLAHALARVEAGSRELNRSNKALQAFAGQVSHDLKNPLTGVLGFIATMADLPAVAADPDARRFVDRSLSAATRMWSMIDGVLAHASLGGRPDLAVTDLGQIVAQVLEDLGSMIRSARATVTADPLFPVVIGDPTQLRILLQNLVANAVKFRDRNRPCHVHIGGSSDSTGTTVTVADNGIGIPREDRARVFDMFTRLRTDVEGSGIGLATCQRIVESHRATLVISETPGGGTTFSVTIPHAQGAMAGAAKALAASGH